MGYLKKGCIHSTYCPW